VFKYSKADERSESFSEASCRILIALDVDGFSNGCNLSGIFATLPRTVFIRPFDNHPIAIKAYWCVLVGKINKRAYVVIGYLCVCDTKDAYHRRRNNCIFLIQSVAHSFFVAFNYTGVFEFVSNSVIISIHET